MLSAAGIAADPSIMKELEEDCKPDYTAEAIDELDIIAQDFESSSDGDDKDIWNLRIQTHSKNKYSSWYIDSNRVLVSYKNC